jgi:hypothetical protein
MQRFILVVFSLLILVGAASLALADKSNSGKFAGKAGDTIFVCGCGESCKCGTIGLKEGKCGCGQNLVKTTVTKVENGKVLYSLEGKSLSAPQQGKYVCGCGEGCDCGFISQKPGTCGCGKELVKVSKK